MDEVRKAGVWCVDETDRLGLSAEDQVFTKAGTPDFNEDGTRKMEPTFHLVDDQGQTTMVVYRAWAGLRRAAAASIPKARLEGITLQQLANLGYETYDAEGNRVRSNVPVVAERPRIQVVSSFTPAQ